MTVLQVVLAALIPAVFAACAWLTHWDVAEECEYQARLDDLWADEQGVYDQERDVA